ncbi:MAG: hypothetical protein WCL39_03975, partial [Armatimonadota bacterium]
VTQGYPFYSGRMLYSCGFEGTEGSQTFLRLKNPSGTLFNIRLNGRDAGRILWRPYLVELTELVRNGYNDLEIEVVSSLQNTWGPLHEKIGDDNNWCSPAAFELEKFLREEFSLYDYGLLGGAEIVVLPR